MNTCSQSIEERFFGKVVQRGECLEWAGARFIGNYGKIKFGGKSFQVHRLSFEIHYGPIPPGLCVCHTCDNPPCCNPEHLFLGTKKDNAADRDRKCRDAPHHGNHNGMTKLSERDVVQILADKRTQRVIAANYGVSRSHVGAIKRRVVWSHVAGG